MRILRSIHSLNPAIGGPIESVKQSSAVLSSRGHHVDVLTLDAPTDPWIDQFPVPVHALGPRRGSYGYVGGLTQWLKQRRGQYDAVLIQGLWQYSSLGVWRALHGTGTPYFVFPHGMLDPWFNRTYPLKHLKKLLYWPWAEYRVLRDATAVLFTSEEERRLARESFWPYRCHEVVVNYGTVGPDVDRRAATEAFLNAFPQLRGKRFLLFLGRLHEKKGCDILIRAFARIRRSSSPDLVMAGPCADEHYLARLKESAAAVGERDHVHFTGMLTDQVKWGAFYSADAFVLPSHQENFGIAVAEALACATPVLISNKVNIWREIVNDGAGFADDDNFDGTTRLFQRWIDTPEAERAAMQANARRSFESRFEINSAVDSLLGVLKQYATAE